MNKINRIIFCIIDDLRSEHLFEYINKNLLPNIKTLMSNGIYSKNCITDFPAVTYPTQVSMITGTYTGNYQKELCHGIPAFSWMDRTHSPPILRDYGTYGSDEYIQLYKLNGDIGKNCRTLPEMINEGNKSSIGQFINRGSHYFFPESKIKMALYYLLIRYSGNVKKFMFLANSFLIKKLIDNFEKPKKYFTTNEPPICSLLLFFTSDILMHLFGYDSKAYKLNLMLIDKLLGVLIKRLEKLGYLDDTAIAISADHGNYKANKLGDLRNFFNQYGLTHYHPYRNKNGNINVSELGGIGIFNFKSINSGPKRDWTRPNLKELEHFGKKKINLLHKLFEIKDNYLMFYADDENDLKKGLIHLNRKNKTTGKIDSGFIEYKGIGRDYKTRYCSESKDSDIFNYFNDELACKLLDERFHSTQEWLSHTYHINYSIYPDLIPRHFKNPRGADIITCTQGNIVYNIKHGKRKGESLYQHDIGLKKNIVVPLLIGGSNQIPIKEIPFCKTTDIVPTLLKMLGKKPYKSVIGNSLI
ncbi:MAG: alkaline phosphatase family protein [Promethearchaeota archaeon]